MVAASPIVNPLDIYRTSDRTVNNRHFRAAVLRAEIRRTKALKRKGVAYLQHVAREDAKPAQLEKVTQECPNPVPFRVLDKNGELQGFTSIACKRWGCAHCGPVKQKRYTAHFVEVFKNTPDLAVLTLTIDPKIGIRPDLSPKYIKQTWEKFRKRINRELKKSDESAHFRFVGTFEPHKSGMYHLHVVCNAGGLSEEIILNHWFNAGGGITMYLDRIEDDAGKPGAIAQKIGYCMKYALKGACESVFEGKSKFANRVIVSQGDGYNAQKHKTCRKQIVEEKAMQNKNDKEMQEGSVLMFTDKNGNKAGFISNLDDFILEPAVANAGNPDAFLDPFAITEEEQKELDALQLGKRSTRMRSRDKDGNWKEYRMEGQRAGDEWGAGKIEKTTVRILDGGTDDEPVFHKL